MEQTIMTNAQSAARYAVRTGKLIKPKTCSKCGDGDCKIDGHHRDYAKPLEVEWLCASCHRKEHQALDWIQGRVKGDQIWLGGKNRNIPLLQSSPAVTAGLIVQEDVVDDHLYFAEEFDYKKVVNELPPQEALAIKMKYGFKGKPEFTLSDIGKVIGVTREMARQIVGKAILRLKNKIKSQKALAI